MGEPSWLILAALGPAQPLPGVEILRRVEALLAEAAYPTTHLDPSTLHYALKRMEEDGLVHCPGTRDVTVPGPRGTTRREHRAVYVITGRGAQALEHHRRLSAAVERYARTPQGTVAPAGEGRA